eukprot:1176607-Prorocentrum_minimum.AAC.1
MLCAEWFTSVDSRRLSTVELKSKAFLAVDSGAWRASACCRTSCVPSLLKQCSDPLSLAVSASGFGEAAAAAFALALVPSTFARTINCVNSVVRVPCLSATGMVCVCSWEVSRGTATSVARLMEPLSPPLSPYARSLRPSPDASRRANETNFSSYLVTLRGSLREDRNAQGRAYGEKATLIEPDYGVALALGTTLPAVKTLEGQ